eukprot:comp17959_c0_seq1/m.18298 comp17959_c0_seq1/g.18298  ORF comp17959_c0_seq1/g.18298 comp17959_c0_seq1/m.18298 type:complete len:124 (-) comp17959_c0_seq1:270-641(-)
MSFSVTARPSRARTQQGRAVTDTHVPDFLRPVNRPPPPAEPEELPPPPPSNQQRGRARGRGRGRGAAQQGRGRGSGQGTEEGRRIGGEGDRQDSNPILAAAERRRLAAEAAQRRADGVAPPKE